MPYTDERRRHIHLIGICGTAMASLAGMLQAQGHRITGSDAGAYPPMSDQLAAMGIPLLQPFDERIWTRTPDLVVVGNAISRGNPELEAVLDRRIPFCSMASMIHDEFLRTREPLVVSGTHGKTTTTSMLAWIYEVASPHRAASSPPASSSAASCENFGTSYRVNPDTSPFLLEGDEYDTAFFDKGPKFLHYFPDALILTHVEFDHADIYADLAQVKTAFKRLVNLLPRRGRIVAYDRSENVTECVARAFCPVERYGFEPSCHWQITDFQPGSTAAGRSSARASPSPNSNSPWPANTTPSTPPPPPRSPQGRESKRRPSKKPSAPSAPSSAGLRSAQRSTASPSSTTSPTTPPPSAKRSAPCAPPTPAAASSAVLEPRSNTLRRNVFEADLVDSLSAADEVVLAAVFKQESIPADERLEPTRVVHALNRLGIPAQLLADADAIAATLAETLREGDVVAILSNGGFGDIYTKLPPAPFS